MTPGEEGSAPPDCVGAGGVPVHRLRCCCAAVMVPAPDQRTEFAVVLLQQRE